MKTKYKSGGKVRGPETPKMPVDPAMPETMGDKKFMQLPYKREISRKLGTKKLPVGKGVPDRMKPPMGSKGTDTNRTQMFAHGGEVRTGDVRDNSKRGKTY